VDEVPVRQLVLSEVKNVAINAIMKVTIPPSPRIGTKSSKDFENTLICVCPGSGVFNSPLSGTKYRYICLSSPCLNQRNNLLA
jgi:hypothetical protein